MQVRYKCQSSATVDETKVQLNTGCDQNSSLSSNHSEVIKKFVTPTIRISMTFQDLGLVPGLSGSGKCDLNSRTSQDLSGSVRTLYHTAVIVRG